MALEMVPWAVHGTKHSAAVARTVTYTATGGAHGVGSPVDMAVRATPTPSNQVAVAPGSALLLAGDPSAAQQSYTMRNVTQTLVEIPASGSSGARTWFVCARVTDPQFEGAQPADPLAHSYTSLEVLSSVPVGATVEVLASVRVPASTSTITNAMITDLRQLAQPKREDRLFARPRVTGDSGAQNWLNGRMATGGEFFPGGAGFSNEFTTRVPDWAVMMIVESDWLGIRYQGGRSSWGEYWMEYGTEYRPSTWPNKQQYEFATQHFAWDQSEGPTYRTNWRLMDTRSIPSKLRGQDVTFVFKGAVADASGAQSQTASMDAMGGLGCRLTFIQQPIGSWEDAN